MVDVLADSFVDFDHAGDLWTEKRPEISGGSVGMTLQPEALELCTRGETLLLWGMVMFFCGPTDIRRPT